VKISVDKHVIGSEKNFLISLTKTGSSDKYTVESVSWDDSLSDAAWIIDGKASHDSRCLETALSLEKAHPDVFSIPYNQESSMTTTLGDDYDRFAVPWRVCMPSSDYKTFLEKSTVALVKLLNSVSFDYFLGTFSATEPFFGRLQRASVDQEKLKRFIDECPNDSTKTALRSFSPVEGTSLCRQVEYERVTSRTGRLKVAKGPDFLTLKKSCRNILTSVYKGGSIVMFDFVACESRVAFIEANSGLLSRDVYAHINETSFKGKLDRDVIKTAVLSTLYGLDPSHLSEMFDISQSSSIKFFKKIREMFKTEDVVVKLRRQFVEEGFIRNKFGKRVNIPDLKLLYNSYIQSSAVDVCALGFMKLIDSLNQDVRPLAVIHDALVVDCPPWEMKNIESVSSVPISGYDDEFPLKMTVLNN